MDKAEINSCFPGLLETKSRGHLGQFSLRALNNQLQRPDIVTVVGAFAVFPVVTGMDTEIAQALVNEEWLDFRRGRVAQAYHKMPGEPGVVEVVVDIREVRGLTLMAVKGCYDRLTSLTDRALY